MIYKLNDASVVAHLFNRWEETLIWSCLQNVMGCVYTNDNATSAIAKLGDFCFLAGKADEELVKSQNNCGFVIMIPQNDNWANMIEKYCKNHKKVTRYAFKKEKNIFNTEKLKCIVNTLPSEYNLQIIDEAMFDYCRQTDWCRDFVSQFKSFDLYKKYGLGVVVTKDGVPVSGASSYSGYLNGIEIEIDTHEKHRRKGLATMCGAKLILECLKRNLYPSWDAQNLWSVDLAIKLGYNFSHEYTAYEVY